MKTARTVLPLVLLLLAGGCASYRSSTEHKWRDLFGLSRASEDEQGLTDDNPFVRQRSILRLVAQGRTDLDHEIAWLVSRKHEEDPQVRVLAAAALRKLDSRQAASYLARNLDDPSVAVRREIVRSLGSLGSAEQVPDLQRLLDAGRESPEIRREAVLALAEIGGPGAIPALIEAFDDPDAGVRAAVRETLVRLSGTDAGPTKKDWRQWWDSAAKGPVTKPAP
jgi:HEAT repeat protein